MRLAFLATLLAAAFPAAAAAHYADGAAVAPVSVFPIDGPWEWGGPDTHFGDRGGAHDGEDLMSPCGTPVRAAVDGRVAFVDYDGASGNYLVVRGDDGDQVYMHLRAKPHVAVGDRVGAGDRLGSVGRTGNASACHLHFETWTSPGWYRGGKALDPRPRLRRWAS